MSKIMSVSVLHSLLFHMPLLTLGGPLTHETVSQGLLPESLHKIFGTKSAVVVFEVGHYDGGLELNRQPKSTKNLIT